MTSRWKVIFEDEFDVEFQVMLEGLQDEILAHALLLKDYGQTSGVRLLTR